MLERILFVVAALFYCEACAFAADAALGISQPAPMSSNLLPLDPVAKLNSLDTRTPVPLLPHMANHQKQNMRSHLEAVQAIITGLVAKNFSAIEKAARSLGLTNETQQMCEMMGLGAKGFAERAIEFHESAEQIADYARKRDAGMVMKSLQATLARCTSCHAAYRQEVVSQERWDALTKMSFPKERAAPVGAHD